MLYVPDQYKNNDINLFEEGRNCTVRSTATHASMLVDCANYYRDLHEALSKARHSIFILGWDLDSRIDLIRDEKDRTHDTPDNLYELLTLKARENPHMQIYLNKWNYAFFMAEVREPLSVWKWRKTGLPNIHYYHDGMLPAGACHHQKIVVVDDEVAFVGGMDVAVMRWDTRDHIPDDPRREDPGGVLLPGKKKVFPPYHDIQTVVSGPAAKEFAKIVRERWRIAAGYEAIPIREGLTDNVPQSWPDTDPPDFDDINVAITRTLPPYDGKEGRFEIEQAYLDEIAIAERFIYMENQYFTSAKLAAAINRRLHERPELRVLMVSSYNPQGFIEKVSMWSGRMRFKKIVEGGGRAPQVAMAYPSSRADVGGEYATIRIHSKIMAVDDMLLSVGSANLNNRSMRLDTECDLVYQAVTDEHRKKIADIRNDLIHEHTGYSKNDVAAMVEEGVDPREFMKELPDTKKKLTEVDDSIFFARFPQILARYLADPSHGWIPELLPLPTAKNSYMQYFTRRRVFKLAAAVIVLAFLAFGWNQLFGGELGTREKIMNVLEGVRTAPLAVPYAIVLYAIAATLFVPVTLLTGSVAIVFGYWQGLLISLTGALISASVGYVLGRGLDTSFKKIMSGSMMERIKQHAENSNIIAITFLRMLPVAPYSAVNFALGLIHVPFLIFIAATVLGLLPGKLIGVFLADSLADLWRNPDPMQIGMAAAGLGAWIGIVWLTYYLHKLWQRKKGKA